MYISRIVVRNFRNFAHLDVSLQERVTCVIGENNTGKTNLLHAIRLAVDANLSSQYRQLTEHDIHAGVDVRTPQQVVISLEFRDYEGKDNECALVGCWGVEPNLARLTYRFRPDQNAREAIAIGELADSLTLEDYHWELTGGGMADPATVTWDENLGTTVRFSDLQYFHVVFLRALRDVEQDLHNRRISPLDRLFAATEIPEQQKTELVQILRVANSQIAERPAISSAGTAINSAFAATAGQAFQMDVRLGMADPSFTSIARSLTLLLTNQSLADFDPSRNGLGLNNILYISMLLEYFERRVANPRTAGQLLLIEEPEAHLHPQLQRTLLDVLSSKPFQSILTTHSTHISSRAPLASYVTLTNAGAATASATPISGASLTADEVADLERYLDATRSTLLYARRVILVEGPAELFLIPPLVKKVLSIDLDREGISVIPIFGVHFDSYAKLFAQAALPKKCAIIADADLAQEGRPPAADADDALPLPPRLADLQSEYIRVFACETTLERALTIPGTLLMLGKAAEDCAQAGTARKLRQADAAMKAGSLTEPQQRVLLEDLGQRVLAAAKRVGKARFAQCASRHVRLANTIPAYIRDAMAWVTQQ